MNWFDHLLVLLVFVVMPIYIGIETRRQFAAADRGLLISRPKAYVTTIITQWGYLTVLMIGWLSMKRPLADLGFTFRAGLSFWIGLGILLLVVIGLLASWLHVKRMDTFKRASTIKSLGQLRHVLPRNWREFCFFVALSITAGIVEEIVFRGYILWYLGSYLSLWPAVLVSSAVFGIGHLYQGPLGAVKIAFVGLGFASLYVLTGSLWIPIATHIVLDVIQGLTAFELVKDYDAKPDIVEQSLAMPVESECDVVESSDITESGNMGVEAYSEKE